MCCFRVGYREDSLRRGGGKPLIVLFMLVKRGHISKMYAANASTFQNVYENHMPPQPLDALCGCESQVRCSWIFFNAPLPTKSTRMCLLLNDLSACFRLASAAGVPDGHASGVRDRPDQMRLLECIRWYYRGSASPQESLRLPRE